MSKSLDEVTAEALLLLDPMKFVTKLNCPDREIACVAVVRAFHINAALLSFAIMQKEMPKKELERVASASLAALHGELQKFVSPPGTGKTDATIPT